MADGHGGDRQELRIAPVMTGGTSLAVWMGGATAELYRMVRAPVTAPAERDRAVAIYAGLLDLTQTAPVVDVITGTSAGGLNGTLLAAATVLDIDATRFMGIRETWLSVANLESLMRSAHEPNPPSLLLGDDYFVPKVRDLLRTWADEPGPLASQPPDVDVVTTVTTLTPEPVNRSDHFGEPMSEVTHAQQLCFRTEDFRTPDWVDKLAIAARTSAGIPGVFEPSFLPVGDTDATRSGRPDFRSHASFSTSRWAVDGGTVVNLPLTEALDRIFHRPSQAQVRRVALYVCPTPTGVRSSQPDDADDVPDLRRAVTTVVTAPRAEGVSADIDAIDRANAEVERQRQVRETLRPVLDTLALDDPAGWFETYRRRRAAGSVQNMLADLRRRTRGRLPADEALLEALFVPARLQLLPRSLDDVGGTDDAWKWGIGPVEQAVSVALSILARTQRLVGTGTSDAHRTALEDAKAMVHGVRATLRDIRERDGRFWEQRFREFPKPQAGQAPSRAQLVAWAEQTYALWPGGGGETVLQTLRTAHLVVAGQLVGAADAILAITTAAGATVLAAGDSPPDAPAPLSRTVLAQAVLDEFHSLGAPSGDPLLVQEELLRVHVAQTLLLGDVQNREQRVDLMQVSWNSWNGIDARPAQEKLAGPELARLGAFLKPSWRANDWCWGRMDAAYRLILLLLDPQRLQQLGLGRTAVQQQLEALTGAPLPQAAAQELAFLGEHGPANEAAVPRSLPETAKALARVAQVAIARVELLNVAKAVRESAEDAGHWVQSDAFVRAVDGAPRSPDGAVAEAAVPALVAQMRIGSETARGEFGYGLMNRVLSRGAAVAVNALTGTASGVPGASRVLRPLRAPLHGLNSLVGLMTNASPLARAVTIFLVTVAGAIVALRVVGADVPTGTFAVSAVVLVATVVVAMLRSGFAWVAVCLVLAASVVGLTLAGSDLRSVLYSAQENPTVDTLEDGTRIDFSDGSVLRVTVGEGDDERVEDIPLDEGAELHVRAGEGEVRGPAEDDHVAGWKRWGFVNEVSVVSVAAALVALVALYRLARGRVKRAWAALALAAGAIAFALLASSLFDALLTGRAPAADAPGKPWKLRVVEVAEDLEGYDLEVVLLTLAGVSLLLSLGTDAAASRVVRRLRANRAAAS